MINNSENIQQAMPKITSMIEDSLNVLVANEERALPSSMEDVYTKEYMKFFNKKRKKEPTALELAEKIAKQEANGAPHMQARKDFLRALEAPFSLQSTHTWQYKI